MNLCSLNLNYKYFCSLSSKIKSFKYLILNDKINLL